MHESPITKPQIPDAETTLVPETEPFEFVYIQREIDQKFIAARSLQIVESARSENAQSFIFLDKSARPLNEVVRETWRYTTDTPPPPTYFFNIGRELSSPLFSNQENGPHTTISPGLLNLLSDAEALEAYRRQYRGLNNLPEGAQVMIIDDVSSSGSTQRNALDALELMFPHIHFTFESFVPQHASIQKSDQEEPGLYFRNSSVHLGEYILPPWSHKPGITGVTDPIPSINETNLVSRKVPNRAERPETSPAIEHEQGMSGNEEEYELLPNQVNYNTRFTTPEALSNLSNALAVEVSGILSNIGQSSESENVRRLLQEVPNFVHTQSMSATLIEWEREPEVDVLVLNNLKALLYRFNSWCQQVRESVTSCTTDLDFDQREKLQIHLDNLQKIFLTNITERSEQFETMFTEDNNHTDYASTNEVLQLKKELKQILEKYISHSSEEELQELKHWLEAQQ